MRFPILDCFCGAVGAWTVGLQTVDMMTVAACEIDPWRRAVFEQNNPNVRTYGDIADVTGERIRNDVGTIFGIFGSPRCQKTSVAAAIWGRRTGETLWPHMLRLVHQLRPEWVGVEQPAGNAPWEAAVQGNLARARYHVARFECAAADFGAPHLRRRVFLLAHACLPRLALAWAAVPSEIERVARSAAAGNPWAEGVPGTLRVAHGTPGRMDGAARAALSGRRGERDRRIEAIGDSFPPVMAEAVGRAIMRAIA